jgi:hypothetical protein
MHPHMHPSSSTPALLHHQLPLCISSLLAHLQSSRYSSPTPIAHGDCFLRSPVRNCGCGCDVAGGTQLQRGLWHRPHRNRLEKSSPVLSHEQHGHSSCSAVGGTVDWINIFIYTWVRLQSGGGGGGATSTKPGPPIYAFLHGPPHPLHPPSLSPHRTLPRGAKALVPVC